MYKQPIIKFTRTINLHPHQVCQWTMNRIPLGAECVMMTYDYVDGTASARMLTKDALAVTDYLKNNRLKYEDLEYVTPKGILKDTDIFRSTAGYMGLKGVHPDTMVLVARHANKEYGHNTYITMLEESEEAQTVFDLEQILLPDLDDLYTNEMSYYNKEGVL